MDRNAPYVTFGRDIRVGNFESFSHYWGRQQPITPESLELFAAVRSAIPGDYAAIDVGANLGITCLALADARFGKVIALEPTPATHERLKSNLLLNPRLKLGITVLAVAAGAQSGRASFQIFTGSSEQNGFMDGSSDRDSANRIQVNVVTIDQLVTANGLSGIGLLKIDVEGFEHEVLRGARQSFERGIIRYVYLELIEEALANAGTSIAAIERLLAGYSLFPQIWAGSRGFQRAYLAQALSASHGERSVLFGPVPPSASTL